MMPPKHVLFAVLLFGLGACSALQPNRPIDRNAAHRLDRGLAALHAGHYQEAFADLSWVYTHCADHARGGQALAGLAALELDPRNRSARPPVASDLLGRMLREPATADFVRPLAESTYLMAQALGAPPAPESPGLGGAGSDRAPVGRPSADADTATAPSADADGVLVLRAADVLDEAGDEPAYGCGARASTEGWVAPRLPELPGPSLVSLLAEAERARQVSTTEAAALRIELDEARERLAATEAELERIRRTLKP